MAIAASGAWLFNALNQRQSALVLKYVKPVGLRAERLPPDPAPNVATASIYLGAIARKCGLRQWSVETELESFAVDADDVARLEIKLADVSDQSLTCLATFVKPPTVTIERKSS